jgi:hypothetical protein
VCDLEAFFFDCGDSSGALDDGVVGFCGCDPEVEFWVCDTGLSGCIAEHLVCDGDSRAERGCEVFDEVACEKLVKVFLGWEMGADVCGGGARGV